MSKKRAYKKGQLLSIKWHDNFAHTTGWHNSENAMENLCDSCEIQSLGFYVGEKKGMLMIAQSYDGIDSFSSFVSIIKSDIISINGLQVRKN